MIRAMRAKHAIVGIVAGAAVVTSLSCTLISDLDVKQCSKDSDCGKYGEQFAEYACQDEICVDFSCTNDASCRARGGTYADNICDENSECVEPECKENVDCEDTGPTATCKSGRCVDDVWGCLKDPPPAESPATLKWGGPINDFLSGKSPANLRAFACKAAPYGCANPVSGPHGLDSDGALSITLKDVLPTGFDGYIHVEADGELPLDFIFPRALRHDQVVDNTSPLAMIPPGTINMFSILFPDVDIDEATTTLITLRLFDCQNKPASGLRLAPDAAPMARFYVTDAAFQPAVDATETDEAGIGGLMNVTPGTQTISVIYNRTGKELFHFRVYAPAASFVLGFIYAKDVRSSD